MRPLSDPKRPWRAGKGRGGRGQGAGDLGLQLLPPGTQRPWPPAALHTSCFRLVLATQQVPVATGRLPFAPSWRVMMMESRLTFRTPSTSAMAAEVMAAKPKRMAADTENFILACVCMCGVDMEGRWVS